MRRLIRSLISTSAMAALLDLRLALALFALTAGALPHNAFAETIGRVAFWVPSERHDEFSQVYDAEIEPFLLGIGFRPAHAEERTTLDSIFSRLYSFDSPGDILAARDSMRSRSDLIEQFQRYGRMFGSTEISGVLKSSFRIYSTDVGELPRTPLGPGSRRPLGPGHGQWKTFDVTDGLAGPMVQAMLQDRLGQMWFATKNNGISRFDGQTWLTLGVDDGLPSNDVEALFEDSDGRLWVGTTHGLAQVADDAVVAVHGPHNGLPQDRVRQIIEGPDRTLWVGTVGGGVSRYDGTSWIQVSLTDAGPKNLIIDLAFDTVGDLWATTAVGISRYDGTSWSEVTVDGVDSSMQFAMHGKTVNALLIDQRGDRWFSFGNHRTGLARLGMDGAWTIFNDEDMGGLNHVVSLSLDAHGRVWAGTLDRGALVYDDGNWRALDSGHGLAHNSVYQVLEDDEGYLWFATMGGASRLDEQGLSVFGQSDGLPAANIHQLRLDTTGALWIAHGASGAGVTILADDTLTTLTMDDGLPGNVIGRTYADREGHTWLLGDGGAVSIQGDSITAIGTDQGLPYSGAYSIIQDHRGDFWFGTGYGLAHFDGRRMQSYGPADGLASDDVLDLHEDADGNLWIASMAGVTRYDGEHFQAIREADGLPNEYVADITSGPDGRVWFATHGGVVVYDGEQFAALTADDGLTSNDVHAVVIDGEDLWVGTDGGGVSRYDGRVFQSLTAKDGLPDNVSLTVAADEGGVWIGGSSGLSYHRPRFSPDVPVLIDAVVAGKRYGGDEQIEVASSVELMAFEFRGISLKTLPGQTVFCYRLVGYDDQWYHTREHRVEYTDLPRGDYRFEVQAVDRDLNYSAWPASIGVVVRLPYERIAWVACLVIALGLIIWQGWRVMRRDHRLQESNRELEEQAAALEKAHGEVVLASQAKSAFLANVSHELRTPMNAIINFSSLILDRAYGDISEDMRDAVEEIDRNSDSLLSLINDVLDLSKIEAGAMQLQMSAVAPASCIDTAVATMEHRASSKGLALRQEVSDSLPDLWADERRLTQQVLINLVENAIKFTSDGEISVGAATAGESGEGNGNGRRGTGAVHFWVQDTGKGIPTGEIGRVFQPFYQVDGSSTRDVGGTGLGLAIVRRFVEMHGGRIWLESAPGTGSTFHFTIPQAPQAVLA